MSYILLSIETSTRKNKKLMAVFLNKDSNRKKTVHFGQLGYSDYTIHKDHKRKQRYIARHSVNENFENYTTAGSLSRYILWNKKTVADSITDYRKRFKI
jgi:hypothetical protein